MQQSIPKVIHYCWFGGKPLPELGQRCIASWRRFLPGYEIKEWNERNFDVYQSKYSAEAYRLKQYAHVSDYARFWILYNYGGIYFDMDVEVIQPLDDILEKGTFMGFECQEGTDYDNPNGNINPGLGMGVYKGHPFFAQVLEYYEHIHFIRWNGMNTGNVTHHTTRFLDYRHKEILDGGIVKVSGMLVYPEEYFCPINCYTNEKHITGNTRSIHHYQASWVKKVTHLQNLFWRMKAICIRLTCIIKYKKQL